MKKINIGTKKAEALVWEFENCFKGHTVDDAYGTCSSSKKRSFDEIQRRCWETEGYNHDLKVTGTSSFAYSTMYSFTNDEGTFLVKDTSSNTYILKVA